MTLDRTDRFLQGASFAIALVRVLRGEKPEVVLEQMRTVVEKARTLRTSIEQHMGESEPKPHA